MADSAKLTHGSIAGHLIKQTVPIMLGVGAIMSVGIIDAYFVGQLGGTELAAISFIFPVTTALASLGVGVIAGVSSVVSRALGEGDETKASHRSSLGIAVGAIVGLVVGLALYALRLPLFGMMGAEGELLDLIDAYMLPYAAGFPLLLVVMGVNGVLRGLGAAKSSTAILITFSLANWILDPILINGAFGMEGMGIAGASYATVLGWGIGAVVAFILLQRSSLPFKPSELNRCNWRSGSMALARVAVPASFSNSINPAGLAILTSLIATEGEAAIGGFGAGGRLETFAVVPLLGLSSSIGAIVGQNWGAKQYRRAHLAMVQSALFCVGYGLAVALLLYFGRDWFASRFSDDAATVQQTSRYLEIAVWAYAGYGLTIVINGALNAIDKANLALALSLARVLLVMVPFAMLLRSSWGPDAIYAAELACNIAGGVAAVIIAGSIFGIFRPWHDTDGKTATA